MNVEKNILSIVIPVYNESENLIWHHEKIDSFMSSIKQPYEVVYVDDGSTDNSIVKLKKLKKDSPSKVKVVILSRNFGKEAATSAGLSAVEGQAAVIMDGDGQHPVELVKTFIDLWHEGNEVIVGVRTSNSGEGFMKKYGSKLFYKILKFIGGKTVISGTTDFRLIDKKVVDEFNKLTERNRVTRNLLDWLGYKRVEVLFEANERHAGTAAYSFRKLFKLAIDGIISHSTRPLKLVAALGLFISVLSAVGGIGLVAQEYVLGDPLNLSISGSAFLALFITFLVGVVLICQGLLALYLESVYYETQNRPLFIIAEKL
jgi:dolichol-phosphate mannosyltransferase